MTEQEADDAAKSVRAVLESTGRYGPNPTMDPHDGSVERWVEGALCIAIIGVHVAGVKSGEAKGGYRAGFEAGQASANKTIAELQAEVAALKATVDQCRAANFIDSAGNVRQVLGTLPLTADGMVAGAGCELWADFNAEGMNAPAQCLGPGMPCIPMSRLYGSREAAEAARKAVKP